MVDSDTVQMKSEYKTIVTAISRLEWSFMIRIRVEGLSGVGSETEAWTDRCWSLKA
jgi:hypothetical protein